MRTGSIVALLLAAAAAAAAVAGGAAAAPPVVVSPAQGSVLGEGAATLDVTIAPAYSDRGAGWGWRVVASTSLAEVADPYPFAQLDHSAMRAAVSAVRNDCAARGMLNSSFCTQAMAAAKDQFFAQGLSWDFAQASAINASGTTVVSVRTSDTSQTSVFLGTAGTWYVAAATSTESAVEWSAPITVVVAPRPVIASTPRPVIVATPVVPAQPVSPGPPSPVALPSPARSAACLGYKAALRRNVVVLRQGRAKLRRAQTSSAKRAAQTRVLRTLATRAALVRLRSAACRLV